MDVLYIIFLIVFVIVFVIVYKECKRDQFYIDKQIPRILQQI